ncbi:MAG: lipid-A-disaccharide synthase [Alphaproteobacteria bacterium]
MTDSPLIYIVAGEASGDALGARLIRALREETGGKVRIAGIGGSEMQAEGLSSLFPMQELSVMGIVEILPHLRRILGRMRDAADDVAAKRPDAVVTIDSPGFARGFVKRIENRDIPRIHYVAPTVWAWRPKRVYKFKAAFNHLLALLPFEPPYFEAVSLPCTFVGHSVLECGADKGHGVVFRRHHAIAPDTKLISVLAGSRSGEVKWHLDVFGDAVRLLRQRYNDLSIVLPTLPHLKELVEDRARSWGVPFVVTTDVTDKYDAMAASDAAIAVSGTVSLELALARVPTVIAYRFNPVSHWIVRKLVKIDHASIVNILRVRNGEPPIIPERLQDQCKADILAADLDRLLSGDGNDQLAAAADTLNSLRPGDEMPSICAARTILQIIGQSGPQSS